MLDEAGLTLQDFDFYEIHEAFAAQVLCTLRAFESADYCRHRLDLDLHGWRHGRHGDPRTLTRRRRFA